MRRLIAETEEIKFFLPFIEKVFNNKNFKKLDRFNNFDFVNHELKLFVEVKDLTDKYGYYKQIPLGFNKITQGLKYIEQGYNVIFLLRWNKEHIGFMDLTQEIALKAGNKIIYNNPHKMFDLSLFTLVTESDKIEITPC